MEKLTLISPSGEEEDFRLAFWARLWALYGFESTLENPFLWPLTVDMKRALLARILAAHGDRLADRADLRLWNEAAITNTLQDKVAQYQLRQVVAQQVQEPEEPEPSQGKKRGRPSDDRGRRAYGLVELVRKGGAHTLPRAASVAYQLDPSIASDSRTGGPRAEAVEKQHERFASAVRDGERARLAHLPDWEESFKRRLSQESEEIKESFRKMFDVWDRVVARRIQEPDSRPYHIVNFWEWVSCEIPPHYLDELIKNLLPVNERGVINGYIAQKKAEIKKAEKPKERPLFEAPGTKPATSYPQK